MAAFLTIDGAQGEGGGQILRTSLALAIITGTPVHIANIRARRRKPGLMRQHLTAVLAAAEICDAQVEGAAIGSGELWFRPGPVRGGEYRFSVGSAGSACLVFQTVLPPLLMAEQRSRVEFSGGTHNSMSPPFDFIARCFVPALGRMGADVAVELERPGFYPAGGGRFTATVEPWSERRKIDLRLGGSVVSRRARALVAQLKTSIADRELRVIRAELGWQPRECSVEVIADSLGPGNVLLCEIQREYVNETICGFGERGVRAEDVARRAAEKVRRYLDSGVAVGEHLADQLMIPMALVGGGCYRTMPLSGHSQTNRRIIEMFLDVTVGVEPSSDGDTVTIVRR
ncbi:MAG: RNA 3'-terminal phosphate cyclase [Myxococcota bacterium]